MKHLLTLLLLGCSGPAFHEFNEERNNSPVISGSSGESQSEGGGASQSEGGQAQQLGEAGGPLGGSSSGENGAGASGGATMAGGPTMGEGGHGGAIGESGPAECLANWQALECARVCTDSASDCQSVLNCFVQNNSDSLDNCHGFTSVGISLAQSAERNCCNG